MTPCCRVTRRAFLRWLAPAVAAAGGLVRAPLVGLATAVQSGTTAAPAGAGVWYVAEGWTGAGFDEYLTIQNPNPAVVTVRVTYLLGGGQPPVVRSVVAPPTSRVTVAVHERIAGVGRDQAVAALVETTGGEPIVVERPMYFAYRGSAGDITGGHVVLGATAPRLRWLFAEGWTGAGFDEYLTIMNPNSAVAPVTITYFLDGGAPRTITVDVAPRSRRTVTVHADAEGVGRGRAVSAEVTTTHPGGIVVERPVYARYIGSAGEVREGHNVLGAVSPGPAWYFPDGNTHAGWDTYLTLMNPHATSAAVTLTYYLAGAVQTRDLTVAANSRATVDVHAQPRGVGRSHAVGIKVATSHPDGLVVERPLYGRYTGEIVAATSVTGAPTPRRRWSFGEGYTGDGFAMWLHLLNPHASATTATITYFLDGGQVLTRTTPLPPQARTSVAVHDPVAGIGPGRAAAVQVDTDHGEGIVVERAIYFAYRGSAGLVTGGHAALGFTPALYRVHGLNFSPFVLTQNPDQGAVVGPEQTRARLLLVAGLTRWVRTFGATGGLEHIPSQARALGLKVAAGAWLGRNLTANETELAALIDLAQRGLVDRAVVGSETLWRGDLTAGQLIAYLQRFRQAVPDVPVATADTYGALLANQAVIDAGDFVFYNAYPYHEGIAIDDAIAALHHAQQLVAQRAGGRPVLVSESGWPSAGQVRGAAVPSPANAAAYFLAFTAWSRATGVDTFYFAALDEPWKTAEGSQGPHWGIMDQYGALKPGMEAVFDDRTVADTWSRLPGAPALELTHVPHYGSTLNLRGRALQVNPATHRVAVYIKVAGAYWVKPSAATPSTPIGDDGTWEVDVTTGGADATATELRAYLIASSYAPPVALGWAALPTDLETAALARVIALRAPA
jgi:exo-beta-1,3-glucanase (GH17 family)